MTTAKKTKVCSHPSDARLGYHTHDQFGEPLRLHLAVVGPEGAEDGGVTFPFTPKGLLSAQQYLADDANFAPSVTSKWFHDNWGLIRAEC